MDENEIQCILEGVLFVSDSPVRLETFIEIFPEIGEDLILQGLRRIQADCRGTTRGIELIEVSGGYQFRTKPQWADWIHRLKKVKAVRLSQSALETLAIVAYRQPVIRPEIEQIRGVDSGWVLRTLMERGLVRMMGRKELPGRPMIYGTTKTFLELFGLREITDLPTLKEVAPPTGEEIQAVEKEGEPRPEPESQGVVMTEIDDVLKEIDSSGDEDGS